MKIQVIGLETCDRCKKLKESLKYAKVAYNFYDCDKDPERCDALEDITGTVQYPMVLISGLETNITEVVYITENISILEEGVKMKDSVRLVPNHSVDGLLRYTMNRLNLKL